MPLLTIGLPTYDDFDGVYFTVQALRLYQNLHDVEILIVDNFGCDATRAFADALPGVHYVRYTDAAGTAAAKNQVFAEATGDFVLCLDSHVLLAPDAVSCLKDYCRANPATNDLLQGPLWLDDLHPAGVATHLSATWSDGMWGQWETDVRGTSIDAPPFEIASQGMGLFACRRGAWPGFNPQFRGFGGEEGYLQARIRRQGGRVLCLPFLRWVHRFARPRGTPYKVRTTDKLRNYLIGHLELELDPLPVVEHFATLLPPEVMHQVLREVLAGIDTTARGQIKPALIDAIDRVSASMAGEHPAPEYPEDEPPPRG